VSAKKARGHPPSLNEILEIETEVPRVVLKPRRIVESELFRSNLVLCFFVAPLLVVILQLWKWTPSVPLSLGGDNSFYLIVINNLTRGRSLYSNPNMGAPTGQFLYDFPAVGDLLNYGYLRMLALVTKNTGLAESLFYFTTFFTAAISCNVTSRRVGINRDLSLAISILFAFLPYHLIKNVQHLMLSNYFALPLIVFALLEILTPREELSKRHRLLILICLGFLAGGTGIYYAIFSLIAVTLVTLFFVLANGEVIPRLKRMCTYISGVVSVVLLSAIPALTYGIQNGFRNFERSFLEVEYYGVKIINFFRPIDLHRIGWLRSFSEQFAPTAIPGEPVEMLGIIGSSGLLLLLLFCIRRVISTASDRARGIVNPHLPVIALTGLIAILLGTVGSFNSLLYVLGLNQIRVWSRITPLIAFCALAFIAITLQTRIERSNRKWKRISPLLIALMTFVGVLDQTSSSNVPQYVRNSEIWEREESFTRSADSIFPEGSLIYQLPNVLFPENGPILAMEDYAQSFPFIHNSHLRWTYGNMKSRPSTFHDTSRTLSGIDLLKYLKESNVAGMHITKRGIEDGGLEIIDLAVSIGAQVVLESHDGEDVLLDLRPLMID
jgi:phosphoglycerol transferase